MRVATIHAPGDIRLEQRDAPSIAAPTDAIIKTAAMDQRTAIKVLLQP